LENKNKHKKFDLSIRSIIISIAIVIVITFFALTVLKDALKTLSIDDSDYVRNGYDVSAEAKFYRKIGAIKLYCESVIVQYKWGVEVSVFTESHGRGYNNLFVWQLYREKFLMPYCPEELKKIRYEHLEQSKLLEIQLKKK
jgi:hypothetical protein